MRTTKILTLIANTIKTGPIENTIARVYTAENREGVLEMAYAVFNEGI